MEWFNFDIADLPRMGHFPCKVKLLYSCNRQIPPHGRQKNELYEVSLRISASEKVCTDEFNGEIVDVPYPNAAYKFPGDTFQCSDTGIRETIAFAYSPETLEIFRELGMVSTQKCVAVSITPEIERLIQDFRKYAPKIFLPGMADRIDWTCFQLYREIFYSQYQATTPQKMSEKISEILLWLQTNYDTNIDFQILAGKYNLSKTSFYREWNKFFQFSPLQYLINLRLENARRLLLTTNMTVAEISQAVNFSCTSAFHTKFIQKFGTSPKHLRNSMH